MFNGSIARKKLEKNYMELPNSIAQKAIEKASGYLTPEAYMLLTNVMSYSENWKVYKTELYNRYKYMKRTKVESGWNLLIEHKHVLQFRYRDGRQYQYSYHMSLIPFTDEDIKLITQEKINFLIGIGLDESALETDFTTKKNSDVDSQQSENQDTEKTNVDGEQSTVNSPQPTHNKDIYTKDKEIKNTYKELDLDLDLNTDIDNIKDDPVDNSVEVGVYPTNDLENILYQDKSTFIYETLTSINKLDIPVELKSKLRNLFHSSKEKSPLWFDVKTIERLFLDIEQGNVPGITWEPYETEDSGFLTMEILVKQIEWMFKKGQEPKYSFYGQIMDNLKRKLEYKFYDN